MKTESEVAEEFKAELKALFEKYNATITAADHFIGYAECGEDIRMTVDIPAIYDADHNCTREYTQIDLGECF